MATLEQQYKKIRDKNQRYTVRLIVMVSGGEGDTGMAEHLEYLCEAEELDAATWGSGPVNFVTKNAVREFKKVNGL